MTDLMARLRDAGLDGYEATVGLRAVKDKLTDPTPEAQSILHDLGAQGDSFEETLRLLSRAFATLDSQQRAQVHAVVFGANAVRAAAILIHSLDGREKHEQ